MYFIAAYVAISFTQRSHDWSLTALSLGYASDCGQILPAKNTSARCRWEQGTAVDNSGHGLPGAQAQVRSQEADPGLELVIRQLTRR
jgi:hypothetical protein